MNNSYEQLKFKMYVCEKCESVSLIFNENEPLVCDACGGKLIEVEDKEKENE